MAVQPKNGYLVWVCVRTGHFGSGIGRCPCPATVGLPLTVKTVSAIIHLMGKKGCQVALFSFKSSTVHLFNRSLVRVFIRSFVHSFNRSFVQLGFLFLKEKLNNLTHNFPFSNVSSEFALLFYRPLINHFGLVYIDVVTLAGDWPIILNV